MEAIAVGRFEFRPAAGGISAITRSNITGAALDHRADAGAVRVPRCGARKAPPGRPPPRSHRGSRPDATRPVINAPNPTCCGLPQLRGDPPLRCVLFDAGLTLIQVATSTAQIARIVLDRRGVAASQTELDPAMSLAEERIERFWRRSDWFASEAGVRELFVGAYAEGLASLRSLSGAAQLTGIVAQEMYGEYARPQHWRLYPDVAPTMACLQRAGIAMGVVSDWGHGLEGLLLELGLGGFLSFLVVSARLGVTKPDPLVFRMALGRVGVGANSAVYVGDTYVKDVLGARAAGIVPVLLDRDRSAPCVDCPNITSLDGLLGLIGLQCSEAGWVGPARSAVRDRQES